MKTVDFKLERKKLEGYKGEHSSVSYHIELLYTKFQLISGIFQVKLQVCRTKTSETCTAKVLFFNCNEYVIRNCKNWKDSLDKDGSAAKRGDYIFPQTVHTRLFELL